ncbi:MAG: hypothetical protein J0L99_09925 [Chitinophagales bacterium]|nr:hypothetical protein [Chitinophagales bacterium]
MENYINASLFKLTNRHQDAVELLHYLKPFFPNLDDAEALDRTLVAQKLFGHRANPEVELRKAMSNLNIILRRFLLFQSVMHPGPEESPGQQLASLRTDLALMHLFQNRYHPPLKTEMPKKSGKPEDAKRRSKHAEDLIEQTYNNILSKIEQIKQASIGEYNTGQQLQLLIIHLETCLERYNYMTLQGHPEGVLLLETIESLSYFFHYLHLDLLTSLQFKLIIGNAFTDQPQYSNIAAQYLEQAPIQEIKLPIAEQLPEEIHVYRLALRLLKQLDAPEGIAAFEALDSILQSEQLQLPAQQIQGLRAILRAYCGIMINKTQNPYFQKKRFQLYQKHIYEEMSTHNGKLSALKFSTIISDALRLGPENHAWADTFLQHFENGQNLLTTETPREIFKVNKANLRCHQGQYREAANELIGYEWYGRIDEPQVLLLAIRIDLKTRYERGLFDDEHTLRTLDAVEKRVGRLQEINPQLSGMTLAFLRLVKQLFNTQSRLRQPKTSGSRAFDLDTKRAQLLAALEEQPVAEKGWLREKVEGL